MGNATNLDKANDPVITAPVTVAGRNGGNGKPLLRTFNVRIRESKYQLGEHWDEAETLAKVAGIEGPYVSFDSEEADEIIEAGKRCALQRASEHNPIGSDRQVAIQLMALRWFEECLYGGVGYDMSHLMDIADPGSVSKEEIDEICQRINFSD